MAVDVAHIHWPLFLLLLLLFLLMCNRQAGSLASFAGFQLHRKIEKSRQDPAAHKKNWEQHNKPVVCSAPFSGWQSRAALAVIIVDVVAAAKEFNGLKLPQRFFLLPRRVMLLKALQQVQSVYICMRVCVYQNRNMCACVG